MATLKYFEIGRAALLRLFDYDYREMQAPGYLWPIVEVHLNQVRAPGDLRAADRGTRAIAGI
ncbi:MAG: FIG002571: 4-hydroxybenzoyl-CoA thioesterase domain protein [uncultured Caballeronia sp.]|nr:MAG: FIG002571: 4-hydroxybenzoyl-CoA thioesterase domain protein [uncultured Caballeronia sp.]